MMVGTYRAVLLLSVAAASCAARAGWESWLKSDIYRASFETYDYGEGLSNKGTKKGFWTLGDAEASAAFAKGENQYIRFSTDVPGIVFTPDSTGNRVSKSVQTSAQLPAYEEGVPDLSKDNPKGAFAIYAPANGETNFVGWANGSWKVLRNPSVPAVPGQWYDVSMKFVLSNGFEKVQYRVRRHGDGDDDYVTLYAFGDPSGMWFDAGSGSSDGIVNKIELRGEGAFSVLKGSEPRRGLLIGLVPWREMLIDESVYHHGSGDWYVFDYNTEKLMEYPAEVADGDAYGINVPEGEDYTGFKATTEASGRRQVIEFAVRFMAPNDNDATPTNDVCALVRLVEMPLTNVTQVALGYQFACLANGGWHTNDNPKIQADVDADYTIEIALDRGRDGTEDVSTVSYRVKAGRGAESGPYQDLCMNVPVSIGDPLFTFFGGIGRVYSIKSTERAEAD